MVVAEPLTAANYQQVLACCKVRVEILRDGYRFREIGAYPLEAVPPLMCAEDGWHGDHWRFSTVHAPVLSVLNTWESTPNHDMCVLTLRRGGFCFMPWDRTLLEDGAGI